MKKASYNIFAPAPFWEKSILEKAKALITKHQDFLERVFLNSSEEHNAEPNKEFEDWTLEERRQNPHETSPKFPVEKEDDKFSFHDNQPHSDLEVNFEIAVKS